MSPERRTVKCASRHVNAVVALLAEAVLVAVRSGLFTVTGFRKTSAVERVSFVTDTFVGMHSRLARSVPVTVVDMDILDAHIH